MASGSVTPAILRIGKLLHRKALKKPILLAVASLAVASRAPAAAESCFDRLALSRNYTLGAPRHVLPEADGTHILYLRSGPTDTTLHLYEFDTATKTERELAKPADEPEHLSTEEKARRERTRMTFSGITDFAMSEDGHLALATQGESLIKISLPVRRCRPAPWKELHCPASIAGWQERGRCGE